MAKRNSKKENAPVEEKIEEAMVATPKTGRVFDCARLNVRKNPKPHAPVVCDIACNTEVVIDEDKSTNDFYKITTSTGVEGFCMKRYILESASK